MVVSILDWVVERFQDALLIEELDPGLFRHQGDPAEKKEARIAQFLDVLRRAIGTDARDEIQIAAIPKVRPPAAEASVPWKLEDNVKFSA